MNKHGRPTRAGEIRRQAGAVATAIKTGDGLCWQVRRERDDLIRMMRCWLIPVIGPQHMTLFDPVAATTRPPLRGVYYRAPLRIAT